MSDAELQGIHDDYAEQYGFGPDTFVSGARKGPDAEIVG